MMIAFIHGTLAEVQGDALVIDVNGVGYLVRVPVSTLTRLPAQGQKIHLHTHLLWREDGPCLFGFGTQAEVEAFRSLLNVAGVGPKAALAVLSAVTPDTLRRAVVEENEALLTTAPGVGKKTARRIIVELKDKLGDELSPAAGIEPVGDDAEVVAALLALGYSDAEARRVVQHLRRQGTPESTEGLLRAALQWLGQQKNI